jgi:hypothetical protein
MIKKILYLVVIAISFFATATESSAHDPWPECGSPGHPCPFVEQG